MNTLLELGGSSPATGGAIASVILSGDNKKLRPNVVAIERGGGG